MQWHSALSQQASLEAAVNECLDKLAEASRPIHLALVFVQSSFCPNLEDVSGRLRKALAPEVLLGCSGGGVIGEALEVEHAPALAVLAGHLPEVELQAFYLQDDDLPSQDAPPEAWHECLGVSPEVNPGFVLLADPFDFELESLLRGLDYAYPRASKVGGLASDSRQPGGNRLLLNHQSYSRGLVGLALSGNCHLEAVVAQGCRAIGPSLTVTRGERNLIYEIDGRPPLEILQQLVKSLDRRDRKLAESSLFLGFASKPEVTPAAILGNAPRGDAEYLIRNLIGVDARKGSLVVGCQVRSGQSIRFHLRDAAASAQDLKVQLERYSGTPAAALLFSCLGRGEHLYRRPHHDAQEFHRHFPQAALGGFFCNGEIGPVGQTTYLHAYTSSFAMIRPAQV